MVLHFLSVEEISPSSVEQTFGEKSVSCIGTENSKVKL